MNRILLLIVFFASLYGCEKQEIGYLDITNAAYIPDTVRYKATLNPDNPDDAYRAKFQIPFQGPAIQGIQGTLPISYSIYRIECSNSAGDDVLKQFQMGGKGKIEWAWDHTIPPGKYIFSIQASNIGHTKILNSALTIVLE